MILVMCCLMLCWCCLMSLGILEVKVNDQMLCHWSIQRRKVRDTMTAVRFIKYWIIQLVVMWSVNECMIVMSLMRLSTTSGRKHCLQSDSWAVGILFIYYVSYILDLILFDCNWCGFWYIFVKYVQGKRGNGKSLSYDPCVQNRLHCHWYCKVFICDCTDTDVVIVVLGFTCCSCQAGTCRDSRSGGGIFQNDWCWAWGAWN